MAREVYCCYRGGWIPLGRARSRCPRCGAALGGEAHRVRDTQAAQEAANRIFQSDPITFGGRKVTPMAIDVGSREAIVRRCDDAELLRTAMDAPSLQAAVRQAIDRRLRALRKQGKA